MNSRRYRARPGSTSTSEASQGCAAAASVRDRAPRGCEVLHRVEVHATGERRHRAEQRLLGRGRAGRRTSGWCAEGALPVVGGPSCAARSSASRSRTVVMGMVIAWRRRSRWRAAARPGGGASPPGAPVSRSAARTTGRGGGRAPGTLARWAASRGSPRCPGRHGERLEPDDVLVPGVQGEPGGRQHPDAGAAGQGVHELAARLGHVLGVVEHQQQPGLGQGAARRRRHVVGGGQQQSRGHRLQDPAGSATAARSTTTASTELAASAATSSASRVLPTPPGRSG